MSATASWLSIAEQRAQARAEISALPIFKFANADHCSATTLQHIQSTSSNTNIIQDVFRSSSHFHLRAFPALYHLFESLIKPRSRPPPCLASYGTSARPPSQTPAAWPVTSLPPSAPFLPGAAPDSASLRWASRWRKSKLSQPFPRHCCICRIAARKSRRGFSWAVGVYVWRMGRRGISIR
jgi:hypothetical protein